MNSDLATAVVPLSRGYVATIDEEDAERVLQHKWCAFNGHHRNGIPLVYAMRNIPAELGATRRGKQFLHRFVLNAPANVRVDHIDGDSLNNRKENLRFATPSQNMANSRKRNGTASRFKGVVWFSPQKQWAARITVGRLRKHLGYFVKEQDAALAYNRAAYEYFGAYARLNVVEAL